MNLSSLEILLIKTYRAVSSPIYSTLNYYNITVFNCRYTPSCSQYAEEAIRKHGVIKGTSLAFRRILRCRPPFGGIDNVP